MLLLNKYVYDYVHSGSAVNVHTLDILKVGNIYDMLNMFESSRVLSYMQSTALPY